MRYFFLVVLISAATSTQATDLIRYAEDVQPILRKYCAGCHHRDDAESGFAADSHDVLLKGGDNGPVITPGSANSSRLLQFVRGTLEPRMPPEDEAQLTDDEVSVIENWIDQGAAGPGGDVPMTRELSTPEIEPASKKNLPITAVAVSADGKARAVARFGRVTIAASAGTGDQDVVIDDLPGKVNSLKFSRNGRRLLVASGLTGAYGRAAIYDADSGKLITEMIGHRDAMYCAVFSPDETMIATAGYDRIILLWDSSTGQMLRELTGHNGAIFDLAFSADGKVLASACADETVKLWDVATGNRLDTLSQPEGEVFAVAFSKEDRFVVAASSDNRLRVWRFLSKHKPRINPIVATRFVDESPLVDLAFSPDGDSLIVMTAGGNLKVIRVDDWSHALSLPPLSSVGSDLCVTPDGSNVFVALMSGELDSRELPKLPEQDRSRSLQLEKIYLKLDDPHELNESQLRKMPGDEATLAQSVSAMDSLRVPGGVVVTGVISEPDQWDQYQWVARRGEVWAIDADVPADSPIDPFISVRDESGDPVLRVRLKAIRDSYFTFRGKDSMQVNDFRVFNWQEMQLGQYLYAAGEVTRLWMHPRGPDSGFNVYPGQRNRWTYFGTTHSAHALGEPAYIVRPLADDETPIANGLPVFDIYYENDDDPMRVAGKGSRLLFTAPRDGAFAVRISDTRGDGGSEFKYRLSIRAAEPDFKPSVGKMSGALRPGTGREFVVDVQRKDGFDGPVTFECENLPPEVHSTFPVVVEKGQKFARGSVWIGEHTRQISDLGELTLTATAMIGGRRVRHHAGQLAKLSVSGPPKVIPTIHPIDRVVADNEEWTLQVHRGETVSARVLLRRQQGFEDLVAFGKEDAARSATQGVYVDNIGLNGLLLPAKVSEREFFLTADPTAEPGTRPFYLRAQVDGNVTSFPILVEVLP